MPPPSYQLNVMSSQAAAAAQCPYPQAPSPALLQQYQYHRPPPPPPTAAPPLRASVPHCSDYYMPVMTDHHSYQVNIPNSQQQQQQQQLQQQQQQPPPQPCFTGVYETRTCTPNTLPGMCCSRNRKLGVYILRILKVYWNSQICTHFEMPYCSVNTSMSLLLHLINFPAQFYDYVKYTLLCREVQSTLLDVSVELQRHKHWGTYFTASLRCRWRTGLGVPVPP